MSDYLRKPGKARWFSRTLGRFGFTVQRQYVGDYYGLPGSHGWTFSLTVWRDQ